MLRRKGCEEKRREGANMVVVVKVGICIRENGVIGTRMCQVILSLDGDYSPSFLISGETPVRM
jgi:glyoxylate carboligase